LVIHSKNHKQGSVQVVQDGNNEVTAEDDVFLPAELIDPHRVAPFTNLEEI
jgi:hypothetical protein